LVQVFLQALQGVQSADSPQYFWLVMVAHGPLASFGIAETANILHPMNHKPYNLKFDGSKACLSALHDFIIC
jgi:hypothetical protein